MGFGYLRAALLPVVHQLVSEQKQQQRGLRRNTFERVSVEFAALLISAAAFVLSGWATWNSHRQAGESRRQADAAEDQLAMMREEQDAADARQEELNARPWRLTRYNAKSVFQLTNLGSRTLYDIRPSGGSGIAWHEEPEDDKLGPGESATIFVVLSSGGSRRLTVRWAAERGGEANEMSLLIPG